MRRHAKASTAGSNSGTGSRRRLLGRALAARGASRDTDGSGAPSGRPRLAVLAVVAVAALLAVSAATASATVISVNLEGSGTGTVKTGPAGIECSNTPGNEKSDCAFDFPLFTFLRFTATPDYGSAIVSMSGVKVTECEFTEMCKGGPVFFAPEELNVRFLKLPAAAVTNTGPASEISASQATLEGTLNPGSADFPIQECFFEVGQTTAYGKIEPCQPTSIPAGTADVPVNVRLGLLAPSTPYHYRLVTLNAGGVSRGADRTLVTQAGAGDSCPNASIRTQQGSSFLPDCRAYEMVSPAYKNSQAVEFPSFVTQLISPDGNTVAWTSKGVFADAESSANGSGYKSERTADGWGTFSTSAPFSVVGATNAGPTSPPPFLSGDLSHAASCGKNVTTTHQSDYDTVYKFVCARQNLDHTWSTLRFEPFDQASNQTGSALAPALIEGGASFDMSVLVGYNQSGLRLLPGDTATGTTPTLYAFYGIGGPNTELKLVNVDNAGNLIGPSSAPRLGGPGVAYRSISQDGSTIYFTATPTGGVPTVYARTEAFAGGAPGAPVTVAISNPEPAECTSCDPTAHEGSFMGASEDGSKVYFTTEQQLLDTDTDSSTDLYRYDMDGGPGKHLFMVSGGGAGDLTPGSGAEVSRVMETSLDGNVSYFIAKGALATLPNALGQSASAGGFNLYRVQRDADHPFGRTSFVAQLSFPDVLSLLNDERPSQTTPDGRYLVFSSSAALTEDDTDESRDVYRYDAATGSLVRVSIGEAGYPASDNGNTPGMDARLFGAKRNIGLPGGLGEAMSDNGSSIIFRTSERLQAEDLNDHGDIYLWHDGVVRMVSDGGQAPEPRAFAQFAAISPSGSEVAFATKSQVLPQDTDDLEDVYVARIDGGFPYVPPAPNCEANEACHGTPPTAPASSSGGSAAFSGPGNEAAPEKQRKKPHKKHRKRRAHKKRAQVKRTATRTHG